MTANNFVIRNMTRDDMDFAIELASAEGWNPGVNDATVFYETASEGFFVGELDGERIGCISSVAYDDDFGFIGFYIVRPEYRGQGYGWQLWQRAVDYLGNRGIGLHGAPEQREMFERTGYKLAYRVMRFSGMHYERHPLSEFIVPAGEVAFEKLVAYDRTIFPAVRPEFLKAWIAQPNCTSFVAVVDGEVRGYAVMHHCREGHKIAPLFAENRQIADALFTYLVSDIPGEPICIDIPETNPAAVILAQRHELTKEFDTDRMYNHAEPEASVVKIYGITSLDMG